MKKKTNWWSILIYGVALVIIALIIYWIVGAATNPYTTISSQRGIDLILNRSDNTQIYNYSVTTNGYEVSVQLHVVEKNADTDQVTNTYYYTFVTDRDVFFDNNYRPYTIENGEMTYIAGDPNSLTNLMDAEVYSASNGQNKEGTVEPYKENTFLAWLPTILYFVITIALFYFVFKMLMSAGGANKNAFDFNKSRARRVDDSKIKFKDVAGCDEEKAEMVEIVEYLKDPKKFTKYGAKLPKGVLLVGPPGTGKTLLAKAVAGEAGVPFYSISGSDFVEMFVGVGAGRVRDLFKTAKQNAPCVVFIDEIDAVGRQRGAGLGGGNDEREQTLNQLLVELDGFEDNSGVIVIAATNRSDVLDPALLRAGRFDRQITVTLPDKEGREAIFKVHARNKKLDPSIDFGQLAKRTIGFSGADIANILNEAAILAVRAKREAITMADIDEAIDRRIAGIAKSTKGLSEKERRQVAYHESGHAIIGLTLKDSDKVRKITIIPRGQTGGHVLMGPEEDRFLMTKNELVAKIIGYLGGRSSEEIFFKDVSTGASNDIEMATRIARSMVVEYGMSSLGPIQYEKDSGSVFLGRDYTNTQRNFSIQVADEIDKEVRKIIEDAHSEALRIINERKDDVTLIAETLLEYETINEEQIDYLLKNRKMPENIVTQKESALSGAQMLKEEEAKQEALEKEKAEKKEEETTTESKDSEVK